MIQEQHDELTIKEEIIEADDANDAPSAQKCPMISNGNGAARQEEGSVIGDAVMEDEHGFYYEMEEEDDEELYKMLEEDVVNPNDKKAQNIVPTKVKTKVNCKETANWIYLLLQSFQFFLYLVAISGGEGEVQVRRPPGRVGNALP